MFERSHRRVTRYRKLALMERDQARASLLHRLAEEAERGVLCVAPHVLAIRAIAMPGRERAIVFPFWPNWPHWPDER
jgi:hypothetical protein